MTSDGDVLDKVFAALSDPTRREVLAQLARGGATVSELAGPHGMSLPGFMKHLAVLEDAGLVSRAKAGRVVRCELLAEPMQEAAVWLAHYRRFWEARLDALGRYLYHDEEVNPPWPTPVPSAPKKSPSSNSSDATPPPRSASGARGRSRKR